eukprot:13947484-Alexandrium_andersonii.AAC.1
MDVHHPCEQILAGAVEPLLWLASAHEEELARAAWRDAAFESDFARHWWRVARAAGADSPEALARHLTRTYSEEPGGGVVLPWARIPAIVLRRVMGFDFVAVTEDIARAALPGRIRLPAPVGTDVRPPPLSVAQRWGEAQARKGGT